MTDARMSPPVPRPFSFPSRAPGGIFGVGAKGANMKITRTAAAAVFLLGAVAAVHAQAIDLVQLAGSGTAQQVQDAVKNGADVNASDKDGKTPLMASTFNTDAGVVTLLLKAGANVNARQQDGGTALMYAAVSNLPAMISALVNAGARVNDQDQQGGTALIWAAAFNPNSEVILLLLKAGSDPNAKTAEGKTAFDLAQDNTALKGTDAYKQLQAATK
jgi:ankyrin repeat protein